MWQLDFVRFRTGIEQVSAFEVAEVDVASESVRVYDIRLRSDVRLEMKDWTYFFEGSLRSQFRRDVHIRTNGLDAPEGLSEIEWVFRDGAGRLRRAGGDGPRPRRRLPARL